MAKRGKAVSIALAQFRAVSDGSENPNLRKSSRKRWRGGKRARSLGEKEETSRHCCVCLWKCLTLDFRRTWSWCLCFWMNCRARWLGPQKLTSTGYTFVSSIASPYNCLRAPKHRTFPWTPIWWDMFFWYISEMNISYIKIIKSFLTFYFGMTGKN